MKQRITYLLPKGHRVDPSDIVVNDASLNFTQASQAAEEWRITWAWDELPLEMQPWLSILSDCHELHLRWSAPHRYSLRSPLVSRLPPGLHGFYTPRKPDHNPELCRLIGQLVGDTALPCLPVSESWTKPSILSERFSSSATYQFYHYPVLQRERDWIFLEKVFQSTALFDVESSNIGDELHSADYIDIDFDAISNAVVLTAFWSPVDPSAATISRRRGTRRIQKKRPNDRVEVGVLHPEVAKEPEELSLGGLLTVLGDNDHPSKTLFSFPSRHHPSPAIYKATFGQPTGLHPELQMTLARQHLAPPKASCGLHAYWTLPSALFIDRYQFSDSLFLESKNLVKLHSLSGEEDLEAPDWVVNRWGSAALIQLAAPGSQHSGNESALWTVTIPTHLRYLATDQDSTAEPGYADLEVPWPIIFWACEAEEGLKMATNPFDRVNLGYDGLFGPKTMFYHIPPAADVLSTAEKLRVPVMHHEKAGRVPVGTMIAVALGFAWVCWKLGLSGRRSASGRALPKEDKKDK